jgi:hypothetical protein
MHPRTAGTDLKRILRSSRSDQRSMQGEVELYPVVELWFVVRIHLPGARDAGPHSGEWVALDVVLGHLRRIASTRSLAEGDVVGILHFATHTV